jgi:hypothetical protein
VEDATPLVDACVDIRDKAMLLIMLKDWNSPRGIALDGSRGYQLEESKHHAQA